MSYHKKPDGRWFVAYRDENRKWRCKYFGRGDRAEIEAQAYDKEIEADRIRGNRPKAPTAQLYFDELCQQYVDDRRVNGASARYIKHFLLLMNNRIGPRFKDRTVKSIEYNHIIKVINELWPNPDNSPSRHATQQRILTYLKAVFRFGVKNCKTGHNPLTNWVKTKEKPQRSQLTVTDLEKIMKNSPEHLNWALKVELNLGTRPGVTELFAIKWSDVDSEEGKVRVYGSKTKKNRFIPVSEEFLHMIEEKKKTAKTPYLIEYKGEPIKKLRRSFQTAVKNAGIAYPVRMYDIRHLCATTMLNAGADMAAVADILGTSIKMIQETYYELMAGEKERAVSMLPKINVAAKPKPEKKSGTKKSQQPESPTSHQSESKEPAPAPITTPEGDPPNVISIDGFKKRMLVNVVGH
jgi:integrase